MTDTTTGEIRCEGCGVEHNAIRDGRLVQVALVVPPGQFLCHRCRTKAEQERADPLALIES